MLQAARQAEKAAKNGGRNALALTICRRSGEHSTANLNWDLVGKLQDLVEIFQKGAQSDRWTYTLRAELPTLPAKAFAKEVHRLIGRLDDTEKRGQLDLWVEEFLPRYGVNPEGREREEREIHRDFVTLCQSASFLARGRDER